MVSSLAGDDAGVVGGTRDLAHGRYAPVAVEERDGALAERRRDDAVRAEGDVVRAGRDARLAHETAVEAVSAHGAVVAARDESLLTRERDVLRRRARCENPRRTAFSAVEGDPSLVAGRHPGRVRARCEDDVVGEERRIEGAHQ